MKLKTLAAAVAILAVLSAIAFWADRPATRSAADPRVGQPLLDPALLDRAAGLRFSDQGKTIELARGADGSWRDISYFGLSADFSKLSSFVNDLAASKIQRVVTDSPERIARLEFNDTKIQVLNEAGAPLWSVTLGKTADGGGRFIGFGKLSRAYLATFNAWLDTDPKSWADATLVSLKPDDLARVEIPFDAGAPLALSRAKKGDPWSADRTPAGQRLKADAVAAVLGSLGSLRFSDTVDPADPAALAARQHARTIRLTPFSGPAIALSLGRKPEEKKLKPIEQPKPGAKPAAPDYETIPAGPVYAFVASSDANAPVNALMKKRACQIDESAFTGLPQSPAEWFEPAAAAKSAP